jgi:tripartite ATP-independent transporter DctP family solute receptor
MLKGSRSVWLVLVATFGVVIALSAQAVAQTRVILAHPFAVGSLEDKANQKFAEEMVKRSGGRLKPEVFPAGQIGGFQQIIQGMPAGLAHGLFISSGTLGLVDPAASVTVWPYMFDDIKQFHCAYASPEVKAFMKGIEDKTGYRTIGPVYKGARQLYTTRPINKIEDLKGLKIRVANIPVYSKPWEALGALPTSMGVDEAFMAIQQGIVDGGEIELQTAYSLKWNEVAKYVVLTSHAMDNYSWILWGKWLESLPADLRQVVEESAKASSAWFEQEIIKLEPELLKKFQDDGATILRPDLAPFRALVGPAMEKALPKLAPYAEIFRKAGKSCG